ncbi:subtilisin family serine protease [Streptacidiphilus sp. MAP12-16]|uniref:S8 family serine peptidase n=1 Tax=Streptacidiphilus sp. MAP12-16 TaxID=3156300 RepID=UPI003514BB2F
MAVTATGAATFALLIGPGGPAVAAGPHAALPQATSRSTAHTVTLITGDIVRVVDLGSARQAVDVQRPHGAKGGVRTETVGKDLYVLPDEVMPYLAAGEVDRRLFDVTTLISQGYDDQHSDGIPVIVGYSSASAAIRSAQTALPGTARIRALPSIHGAALKATKRQARQAWTSLTGNRPVPSTAQNTVRPSLGYGVAKVWLDARVHADLAQSTAQIGAPAAWAAGYDGKGVKVAVLDTGVDQNHPDLAGRVSQAVSFVPGETADDGNGHGTHTTSTVGGSGAASGGLEKGVAPGADLLMGKVLSNSGSGDDSWVIAGMEWAVAQHARVISMSLSGSDPSDGTDPMSQAVDNLSAQSGALFVVAAGNTGAEAMMSSPSAADAALTVAAVDSSDQLAPFSSMGPRFGDYALKPDIAAPGVDILAAKAGGTAATGYYQTMSGTSMATPHVAGAAAILAQEHPGWTGQQLKDELMSTSKQLSADTAYQVGAGRVDISSSINATVAGTGSAYFGFDAWPHDHEAPVQQTLTYSNSGSAAVTLKLSETAEVAGGPYDVDPTAGAGAPAPAGMFTLSSDSVTVPAHGKATVTATGRPAMGENGRRYLGQVVATDAANQAQVRTQIGLYKEDQRYTLHIALKDRSGAPVAGSVELQQFGIPDPSFITVGATGLADVRLPAGEYSAVSYLPVAGSHGPDSVGLAVLGSPEIIMDKDQSLNLDAARANEATAQVPRETEDRMLYADWYRSDGANSTIAEQYLLPPGYDSLFVLPTKKVTTGSFEYETRWRKAYPLLTLTDHGKPVTVLGQSGSALYDGTDHLGAVYAGAGAPADYAGRDVKGRAVIVTRSDALTGTQRAQAAADAGAKLLVVVNDGPGKLYEWVGTDAGGASAVPVVSVTALTGAPLVAEAKRGGSRLGVEGVPNSPYVYDLVDPHPGKIPTDLTYRPRPKDLATVQMNFYGDTAYAGGEFRWDYRPYRTYSYGFPLQISMPGTRTDYVSAQPGTTWAESAVTGPAMALESVSGYVTYRPGTKVTDNWFAPVAHPRNGGGFWSSDRQQSFLEINVPPWTDSGSDHGGVMQDGSDTLLMKVYQDGTLVSTSAWPSATLYPLPTVTSTYTLDLQANRDPALYRLSPSTHTVWKVLSAPVTDPMAIDRMALMQLDYQVATDLAGNRKGGRQTIGLSAGHLPGAVGAGMIAGGTLAVSYDDGATWHPVTLEKTATGRWTAEFNAPSNGFVSLKATSWDTAGNSISQEVTRAYGLKSGSGRGRSIG